MLKEHMRVHDNIREYLCAECGKGEGRWGGPGLCAQCGGRGREGRRRERAHGGGGDLAVWQEGRPGHTGRGGGRPDPSHLLKKGKTRRGSARKIKLSTGREMG